MAAMPLFWNTNMAAMTSCENAPLEQCYVVVLSRQKGLLRSAKLLTDQTFTEQRRYHQSFCWKKNWIDSRTYLLQTPEKFKWLQWDSNPYPAGVMGSISIFRCPDKFAERITSVYLSSITHASNDIHFVQSFYSFINSVATGKVILKLTQLSKYNLLYILYTKS